MAFTHYAGLFFAWMLKGCYALIGNFGWAIWFFTFLTKIVMLPISIIVQLNSIKMVKLYPEMNQYRAKYYGDKDMISEAQYQLYKRAKYHPILDLIPVILQLILLLGVVEGIRSLMNEGITMTWFGLDLSSVPLKTGGAVLIIPFLAALSALIMCVTQNISNVLQSEQSKANKIITLTISVGLSLYLGFFVPAGIGLYWIVSNLFSVLLMYALNATINPKKYIDYEALAKSREVLDQQKQEAEANKQKRTKEEAAKENADYKRFMKAGTKQLVFYSEKNGFYKYFKDTIEYILKRTDIEIHYITSDIHDEVFALESEQFHVYYIGENKLIILMMKLDADVVVMTMPDLQKYHIKRSLIREDTEYVYIDHGIGSINMLLRKHALDHFDTIFANNETKVREIRAQEATYGLKEKTVVECGFSLIDNMIAAYEEEHGNPLKASEDQNASTTKTILIAPSWQEDNLMDLCIDGILDQLLGKGYQIIVRPHPQHVRHHAAELEALRKKYAEHDDFELQTDFSSNKTVYDADILMTDWSGICFEYSFTTLKPTLFIDTPMKIMNPDYEEIGVIPMDIEIRNQIGISVAPDHLSDLPAAVERLLHEKTFSPAGLARIREKYLYHIGKSAEIGGKYLIEAVIRKNK